MRDPVVLLFIAIGLIVSVVKAFPSVLFYWWLATFRPQDWTWSDISYLRISLISGIIVVVGCAVRGYLPRISHWTGLAFVAFLLASILAHLSAGCSDSLSWLDHIFRFTLILLITDRFLDSLERLLQLLVVVGASLLFYASKAGLAVAISGASQYGQTTIKGSYSDSNAFALGIAVCIFFLIASNARPEAVLGRWFSESRAKLYSMCVYVVSGLSALNVMSLHSRGSTLAMAVGIVLFVLTRPNGAKFLLKLIPFALVVMLVVPLPDGFEERMATAFAEEEELDKSAASRPHFWAVAVTMVEAHPFGVGPQCYNQYYDRYDDSQGRWGTRRSVHSAHFQVLAEIGYAGTCLWLFLIFSCGFHCLSVRRRARSLRLSRKEGAQYEFVATCLGCSLVVFVLGAAFYPTALLELVWLNFIAANALNRISLNAVRRMPEPSSEKGHVAVR